MHWLRYMRQGMPRAQHRDKGQKSSNPVGRLPDVRAMHRSLPYEAVSISGYDTGQIEKKEDFRLKPGEVLDVIRFRRSIRQFKQKEIPKEVLSQVLEAGRLTHTAKNMQDVSFVVLNKEKSRIEQMAVSLFRKIKPFADLLSPMARKK